MFRPLALATVDLECVIASVAKQSSLPRRSGLLRRYAPRNDELENDRGLNAHLCYLVARSHQSLGARCRRGRLSRAAGEIDHPVRARRRHRSVRPIIADELGKRLGQQFIVENKPGAAAQLGTDFVAKAEPDGYTLLWTVSDGLSVLPAVKLSLPYKVPDDFAFIGSIAQQPYMLSASARRDFKTFSDLVTYAKAILGV